MKSLQALLKPTACGLLCLVVFSVSNVTLVLAQSPVTVYVSPSGNDTNPGTQSLPFKTLTKARDVVRTLNQSMQADIVVYLRGGTYWMTAPLELNPKDSGTNGFKVIYKAFPNETPILSGGILIADWELYDPAAHIYRANVGTDLDTRQLYVNGIRAVRAREDGSLAAELIQTANGYEASDTQIRSWRNLNNVEMVYRSQWTEQRCGIASISEDEIIMKQPCFKNGQLTSHLVHLTTPMWLENAYELLDTPGEWYLDRPNGYLYYLPRPGETMETSEAIVPVLESLIIGNGWLSSPIHNIQFQGITFSHTTWLQPNTSNGFIEWQANHTLVGPNALSGGIDGFRSTPAAVIFQAAQDVSVDRNTFIHLGGAGVSFAYASRHNSVIGNEFTDISSSGVRIGGISGFDHHPPSPDLAVANNAVSNNFIHNIGVEYSGAPGIFIGYAQATTVWHNELTELPYTGISVGWGWGGYNVSENSSNQDPTPLKENSLQYNLIHNYMRILKDGGGIYTLSDQPDSVIANNYIFDQHQPFSAIYLDEGTQHYTVRDNVISTVPLWTMLWTASIRNNTFVDNYTDVEAMRDDGRNNIFSNNTIVTVNQWPQPAINIIRDAGIEPNYWLPNWDLFSRYNLLNLTGFGITEASSLLNAETTFAKDAIDGRVINGWSPKVNDPNPWWEIDLGRPYRFDQINIVARLNLEDPIETRRLLIRVSNDPEFADSHVVGIYTGENLVSEFKWSLTVDDSHSWQFIRLDKSGKGEFFLAELQVLQPEDDIRFDTE